MDLRIEDNSNAEVIWADLKIHSQNIAIAVVYRPPDDRDFYCLFLSDKLKLSKRKETTC